MSRMIETFRDLSRLSRFSARFLGKPPTTNARSFTISKTTYTPWPSPSPSNHRSAWCFPLVSALDSARTPVFTTLQQLPPGQQPAVEIAVRNKRRKRALSATILYSAASPTAEQPARAKRDVTSRSETFRDKNIFARPRLSTRILDSCTTLIVLPGAGRLSSLKGKKSWSSINFRGRILAIFWRVRHT
jgi:hypothetical protein